MKQGQKVFWSPSASTNKAIRDTSSVLEFTKGWGHKEIPAETHPTAGLELRRSPIQVLTKPIAA